MANKLEQKLQSEVQILMQYMQRLRQEIAGITRKGAQRTPFEGVTERLDDIVESTAQATNAILDAIETIEGAVVQLRARPPAARHDALCDQISTQTTEATEACGFHDLTGQRITRIIRSLKFVEERVNVMADFCGRKEIEAITPEVRLTPKSEGGVVPRGPQRPTEAVTQDEIDALFS